MLALVSACQSIDRGTHQEVAIETEPPGASIMLSDGQRCVSPCRLTLARYQVVTVTASKLGCRTVAGRLSAAVTEPAAAVVGTGTVYDYQLGGAYDLQPNPLTLTLVCGEEARRHTPELSAEDWAVLDQLGKPAPDASGLRSPELTSPPVVRGGKAGDDIFR